MTKYDVRNYLEKIYKIPVVNIETRVVMGKLKRAVGKGYMIKEDDWREAIVDLVRDGICSLISYSNHHFST